MKYYRLIFKKDEGGVAFSEIAEQHMDSETFNGMDWEKPIIRHFDGKYLHFVALDKEYLECMIVGISAYQEVEKYETTKLV
jgi:hypothetical protein